MPEYQWQPVAATVTGAAHRRRGVPNEDAFCLSEPGAVAGMAVADGHGDRRVPRAARGARFAAELAVTTLTRALTDHPRETGERAIDLASARDDLVTSWQDRVLEDFLDRPLTDSERSDAGSKNQDPARAHQIFALYGTTLLAAAADRHSLIVCQIGDGDLGVVHSDGSLHAPVDPPGSIGQFTASMAMEQARDHLRIAIIDLATAGEMIVWACTDGFSGAQADPRWQTLVAEQLSTHHRRHGLDDLAARLPNWLQPAAETAGDDTTMAILVRILDSTEQRPETEALASDPRPTSATAVDETLDDLDTETVPARKRPRRWLG